MRKLFSLIAILFASLQVANADRQIVSLDGEWSFTDPESGTTTVNVPHSWEKFEANKQAFQLIKTCTYEKTVDVFAYAGKRLLLDFEGVNKVATVSVDGVQVGKHDGGFSAFYVDITDACRGKNEVKVSVATTNISINTMPVNSDFTHWAGIYRDVNLVVVDPQVSFSNMDFGSKGVYLNYTMSNGDAEITPTVVLDSKEKGKATITTVLKDATGKEVKNKSQEVALDGSIAQTVTLKSFTFGKLHKWKGVKDPYLYTAEVTVSYNGKVVDKVSQKIGFRSYEVKDGKFYLNGELYQLHGVGMHQERDAATNVSTDEEREEDINTVLEMGANALRTCHYPHNQNTYDLCDEKGIVCWVEVPFYLMMLETDAFKSNCTQCVKEMVKQGINHPSIIVWGIENEVNYYSAYAAIYARMGLPEATAAQLGAYMKELATMVKGLDPSRLVGEAEIDNTAYAQETAGWTTNDSNINTVGFNIYTGWYSNVNGATQANKTDRIESSLKSKLAKYQGYFDTASGNTTNYVMTEYGAGANINQHADLGEDFSWGGTDATKGFITTGEFHPEEYQSYVHEGMIMALYGDKTNNVTPASNIWCAFAWSMFDFSCYRNEGGMTRLNTKGLITSDHKTKKDAFYLYKANWNTTEPFVYICSKRYTERPGKSIDVKVYSNCESVSLNVNGSDLGAGTKVQDGVFVWKNVAIKYSGEANTVTASGSNSGSVVCSDNCTSWVCANTYNIADCNVEFPNSKVYYTEGMALPTYIVKDGEKTLTEGTDYTAVWNTSVISDPKESTPGQSNISNVPNSGSGSTPGTTLKQDTYSLTVTGMGDYSGTTQKGFVVVAQPEITPTITDKGNFATFSSACDFTITASNVNVYKVKVENDALTLTKLYGYIPAGTGVLLYGPGYESIIMGTPTAEDTQADVTDNDLKPTTTADEDVVDMPTSGTVWALSEEASFLRYIGKAFVANRAYIVYDASNAKSMPISFTDIATAVKAIDNSEVKNQNCYNIMGQRISANSKGLVIVNGKKYINK